MLSSFRYILATLAGIVLMVGCSNKGLRPSARDVGEQPHTTSIKIIPKSVNDYIDPRAYDLYVNGLIYEEIGDMRAAVQSYTDALQFYPKSYEIRYALGAAYYQVRQYHDAIAVLDVIEPEDADVYTLRGASYLALGLVDSAKIAFAELTQVDPENTMGYSYLAGIYRQQSNLDSLIWCYQHLTQLRPDNDRQWRELGRLQVEAGDYDAAKTSFQQSLEQVSDATNILSYVGLAELYQAAGQNDSALTVYKQAIQLDPDNVVLNRELAIAYYQMDSTLEAIPYARHLVELSPDDRTAMRRLAMIYMQADSLKAADSLFNVLSLGEKNPVDFYFLGQIATKEQRYQDAIGRFTTFTQMVDTAADGWMALAYSYQKLKQYDQEIASLKNGLGHVTNDEQSINLLFSLGSAYEMAGQIPQAESTFEEVIAKSPDFAPALNYLGYMLADRGERLEYARQLIERAVKITPDNAAYLDSYGWVLYRMGDYKAALTQLKKAVSLDSDPTIFDHLGDTYKALGNLSDARVWWQKALELSPDDAQIKEKLGN